MSKNIVFVILLIEIGQRKPFFGTEQRFHFEIFKILIGIFWPIEYFILWDKIFCLIFNFDIYLTLTKSEFKTYNMFYLIKFYQSVQHLAI